jgi:hypothetical protein
MSQVNDNGLSTPDTSQASTKSSKKLLPPLNGVYHGAFADFGPTEDVVSAKRISDFKALVGKDIVWGYFSNNWFDGIRYPKQQIQALHQSGVVPFVRLMPRSRFQVGGQDPVYTLQKINDGVFDAELRQWAQEAVQSGIPLLIEFGTEVNGNWFSWSGASSGGGQTTSFGDPGVPDGPEQFRFAYRRIIDLFRAEGAHNVTWFFHVNIYSVPDESWNKPEQYYPGDDYIDWIGVSVYGAQREDEQSISFTELMDKHYGSISRIAPGKPMAILEFGVVDRDGGDASAWIEDALTSIASGRFAGIKAVSYWHSNWVNTDGSESHMRIDSSIRALEMYRSLIANPFFSATAIWSP